MQMDKQILSLGFSPCPNDTFIFDALVNGKINTGSLGFDVVLDDVQTLNQWALAGKLHITKLSYGVLPLVLQHYRVLNSGSALGSGVGPLLIGKQADRVFDAANDTVAIPGEHTTANLLFSLAYPDAAHKLYLRYDQIEQAVLTGQVDAGVIIHENRFTYRDKGLYLITELGNYWEQQTGHPIPLGGIVIQKALPLSIQQQVDSLIAQSIAYAFDHYPQLSDYVRAHAQEMEETVMRQHIDLYVNDFSRHLGPMGRQAVLRLMAVQGTTGVQDIFVEPII